MALSSDKTVVLVKYKGYIREKAFFISNKLDLIPNLYKLYNINDTLKNGITSYLRSGLAHKMVPNEYKDWYMACNIRRQR